MGIRSFAVDVNTICGPIALGGLFAFGLSGCVTMQFIVYWQFYPKLEQWTTTALVVAIWLLDLCHSALVAVSVWHSVILPYSNLDLVDVIPWSMGPTVALTALATFLVQNFFAYRIYRLQQNKLTVAGPVVVIVIVRLVAASVTMAEMITLGSYSLFGRPFPSWVFTLGLSLSALADVIITTFLCYFLGSTRSPSLLPSTNRIVDTLMLWTIESGSATCFGAVATLICWLVMPNNRIFLGLYFVVAKLYANSLLATLNARVKMRKSWNRYSRRLRPIALVPDIAFAVRDDETGPLGLLSPRRRSTQAQVHVEHLSPQSPNLKRGNSRIEVRVSQTVEAMYDGDDDADATGVVTNSGSDEEEKQTT